MAGIPCQLLFCFRVSGKQSLNSLWLNLSCNVQNINSVCYFTAHIAGDRLLAHCHDAHASHLWMTTVRWTWPLHCYNVNYIDCSLNFNILFCFNISFLKYLIIFSQCLFLNFWSISIYWFALKYIMNTEKQWISIHFNRNIDNRENMI